MALHSPPAGREPAGPVMPFGVHKGRPVAELPPDYCEWLLREGILRSPALARAVRERVESAVPHEEADLDDPYHEIVADRIARVLGRWGAALRAKHPGETVAAVIDDAVTMLGALLADDSIPWII